MSEPRITRQALHDDGPGNIPPTRVVIHATSPLVGYPHASESGKAASTAVYFTSKAAGGSAHYVADVADEQHCLADSHIAWHAPPNPHSIGIEVCAETEYTREQWLSPQVWPAVARAAARTRELCDRFAIPAARLSVADLLAGHHGICGHMDVSAAWHQSSHSDPGPGFPWAEFMAAVTGGRTPATPPPPPANGLPTLSVGMMHNPSVAHLQKFCNDYNWRPALPLLPVTGNYLAQTKAVIAAAQRQMGITGPDADGSTVGPRTNAALAQRGYRG